MAIQKGAIKIQGSLGDVTFYKTSDGFKVKMKGGPTKSQVKRSKNFARTREAAAEFARAGKAVKLIKEGIRPYLKTSSDSRFYGRLTAEMVKIIQKDGVNRRGQRRVLPEHVRDIRGFRFKKNVATGLQLQVSTEQKGYVLTVDFFSAKTRAVKKSGATHYRFFVCVSDLDLSKEVNTTAVFSSSVFSVHDENVNISFVCAYPDRDVLLIFCGIEYLQYVNGTYETVSSVSALDLIDVQVKL